MNIRSYKTRIIYLTAAFLPLCVLTSQAQTTSTLLYDITARIDVADLLIIHGSTLQWHHPGSGAAVGRHNGANEPTTISTSLDGTMTMNQVAWIPTWSQPPPNEIRFDAFSSVFSSLVPALPSDGILSITVNTISGRGSVTVSQFPDASNDFTLIARFADGFAGSAFLNEQISVVVVPEATTCSLLVASFVLALLYERFRRALST